MLLFHLQSVLGYYFYVAAHGDPKPLGILPVAGLVFYIILYCFGKLISIIFPKYQLILAVTISPKGIVRLWSCNKAVHRISS